MSTRPSGYDECYVTPCSRGDCQLGVGFDKSANDVTAFLVQLQHARNFTPMNWTGIARFDHNPYDPNGHDIYHEGIHIDVKRKGQRDIRLKPSFTHIPMDLGIVIRGCIDYFDTHAKFFKDLYDGTQSPSNAPKWSP